MSSNISNIKNPFVCYFCNKQIQGETELGHTAVCGSVLIPCPNKCGVYTPRSDISNHDRKCPNRIKKSNNHEVSNLHSMMPFSNYSTFSIQDDCQKDNILQVNTSTSNRNILGEMRSLQNRCSIIEQYLNNLSTFNKNKTFLESKEIERVVMQNRLLEEWRDIVNLKLENVRQQLIQQELSKSEAKEHWNKLRQYLLVFEKFKIDVSNLKEALSTEHSRNQKSDAEINQELKSLQEYVNEQNSNLVSMLNEHKNNTDKINLTLLDLQKLSDQCSAKLVTLNFDVKALTRIATDATEKLEIQQKYFEAIEKQFNQMKIDLEILEERPENAILPTGRLLWKIVNVEARIRKAKETGVVLQSPIFYTHEYGYKIRVQLYFNGLNKWKDRYCLICLHVIKGEYDMTLKWPCNIEGTVSLRDIQNFDNPKNFTKFISAKRIKPGEENEDPQESSSTYIFIPHGTLMKPLYLKEDTLFLDIRINRNGKLAQETDL